MKAERRIQMRAFIACPLPDSIRREIMKMLEEWQKLGVSGRIVSEQNLHITIAFLGDIEDPGPVLELMSNSVFPEFEIQPEKIGWFGNLCCLEISWPADALAYTESLREKLFHEGMIPDRKKFRAHITLIRKARVPHHVSLKLPDLVWTCAQPELYASVLTSDGPVYTVVSDSERRLA